jgi:hypothetical protein
MKKQLVIALAIVTLTALVSFRPGKPAREFYQLSVYHYSTMEQEKSLDTYLQNALLPALRRMNIAHIGVFRAIANDTSTFKRLYLLLPLKNLEMVAKIPARLENDKAYQSAGADYINTPYTAPFYSRIETILAQAFPLAPQYQVPALTAQKKDRVYELRSYESASEKIFKNKVKMFNDGDEIGLFKKLNFNAVFYSEVIAGGKMPNLLYMTCFESMADRDAHWKSFFGHPDWKKLSSLPEYQHNVSHIDITFLRPAEYSDL